MPRPDNRIKIKYNYDKRCTLLTKTVKLLQECELSIPQIRDATGLPEHWLYELSRDRVKNPNVNRIQYIFEFLSSSKLTVW